MPCSSNLLPNFNWLWRCYNHFDNCIQISRVLSWSYWFSNTFSSPAHAMSLKSAGIETDFADRKWLTKQFGSRFQLSLIYSNKKRQTTYVNVHATIIFVIFNFTKFLHPVSKVPRKKNYFCTESEQHTSRQKTLPFTLFSSRQRHQSSLILPQDNRFTFVSGFAGKVEDKLFRVKLKINLVSVQVWFYTGGFN